jgi:hypothetical protein
MFSGLAFHQRAESIEEAREERMPDFRHESIRELGNI